MVRQLDNLFSYVKCFRSKDLSMWDTMSAKMTVLRCQQRNVVAVNATKPEFLVTKDEMLVALVTISDTISSPWMPFKNTIPVLSLQPCKRKGLNGPFLAFLGVISDWNAGFLHWQALAETLRTIRGSLLNERHALHYRRL